MLDDIAPLKLSIEWDHNNQLLKFYDEKKILGIDFNPGKLEDLIDEPSVANLRREGGILDLNMSGRSILRLNSNLIHPCFKGEVRAVTVIKKSTKNAHKFSSELYFKNVKLELLHTVLDNLNISLIVVNTLTKLIEFNHTAKTNLINLDSVSDSEFYDIKNIKVDRARDTLYAAIEHEAVDERLQVDIEIEDDERSFLLKFIHNPIDNLINIIGYDTSELVESQRNAKLLAEMSRQNPNPLFMIDSHQDVMMANPAGQLFLSEISTDQATNSESLRKWLKLKTSSAKTQRVKKVEIPLNDRLYEFYIYPNPEKQYSNVIGYELTELRRAQKDLTEISLHDELTGVFNRRYLNKILDSFMASFERQGAEFAVVMLDIDHFKKINDTLGHAAGDQVLVEVSKRLLNSFRENDVVCRFGGDEFIVIVSNLDHETALEIIGNKLIKIFNNSFAINNKNYRLTCTSGIVKATISDNTKTLLKKADTALYHGKRTGRNNYQIYSEESSQKYTDFTLIADLETACDESQFFLTFQPQHDIYSGYVIGFEALIRWQHPRLGILSPGTFIDEASRFGLIVRIDDWVISNSLQWLFWAQNELKKYDLKLSINLSSEKLQEVGFAEQLISSLKEYKINPDRLEIELLENFYIGHSSVVENNLTVLNNNDISIALDDFGTGYSSLSYLHSFPITKIKVAQELVRNMLQDNEQVEIIKAAIAMAKALDVEIIAEGVENYEILEKLYSLGINLIQGYYFSKPLKQESIKDYLESSAKDSWIIIEERSVK